MVMTQNSEVRIVVWIIAVDVHKDHNLRSFFFLFKIRPGLNATQGSERKSIALSAFTKDLDVSGDCCAGFVFFIPLQNSCSGWFSWCKGSVSQTLFFERWTSDKSIFFAHMVANETCSQNVAAFPTNRNGSSTKEPYLYIKWYKTNRMPRALAIRLFALLANLFHLIVDCWRSMYLPAQVHLTWAIIRTFFK